jgi:hypothetical protein
MTDNTPSTVEADVAAAKAAVANEVNAAAAQAPAAVSAAGRWFSEYGPFVVVALGGVAAVCAVLFFL